MARTVTLDLVGRDRMSKTFKTAGGAVSGLSEKLGKLGTVAAAAGAGIGMALGSAITKSLDVTAARGKLQAQLGITAKESQRIGQVSGKLYADAYGDSMETVNGAVKSVIQNMDGMRTASSATLQQTTARAMTLASVMDEDVGKVTESVSQIMRTGLAKSSKEAFDLITRGAQLGGDKAQDLLDTFVEYGTQFRNMGLSGQAAMGLITQGLKAGARNADLVADTIKEFSIEAVAGGTRVKTGFDSLGLSATEMSSKFAAGGPAAAKALDTVLDKLRGIKDPVERNTVAIQLFGTKAEDMGNALYALDPSKAVAGLGQVAGAADAAGKAMGDTASAKVESFKRSLETGLTNVIANEAIPLIQKLGVTATSLNITPTDAVKAGLAVAGVAAAFKGLSMAANVVKGVGGAAIGASKGVFQFSAGLLRGKASLDANAGGAARAGAAVRTLAAATSRGIMATANMVTNLSAMAGSLGKAAFQAGLAATRTVAMTVAQKAAAVASKAMAVATWLVNAAMKANPIGIVITIIMALVAAIVYAYQHSETFRNIVQAVWRGIQTAISYAWNKIIKPVLTALWQFIVNTVAPKVLWFHNNVVKPVFSKIGSIIRGAWTGFIKPAFDAIKTGVGKVGDAFNAAGKFIKTAWGKIQEAAKAPIKFVVNTVLNNGLFKAWNFVAGKFGLTPNNLHITLPQGFATGGRIKGKGGSKADQIPIMASRDEYVVNASATRRHLPLLQAINSGGKNFAMAKSLGLAGDPGGMGLPGFAGGGLVDGLTSFFGKAKDWFTDGIRNAAKSVTDPLLNMLDNAMGNSAFGKMLTGVPRNLINGFLSWIGGKDSQIGGPGEKAVKAARSQIGVPYSWGGGGPGGPSYGIAQGANIRGFDCSGLTEYGWYQATHKSIGGTTYAQKGILKRVSSPRPGDVGQPHPGHTYLMSGPGKIIEAPYTGARVRETGMRSTPYWGRPPWVMDTGGVLGPGLNPPIFNGTGGPEYVLRPDQLAAVGDREVRVVVDVRGADGEFKRLIRKMVRVEGHGSTQAAFGR